MSWFVYQGPTVPWQLKFCYNVLTKAKEFRVSVMDLNKERTNGNFISVKLARQQMDCSFREVLG